jgi:hypothetical protein
MVAVGTLATFAVTPHANKSKLAKTKITKLNFQSCFRMCLLYFEQKY